MPKATQNLGREPDFWLPTSPLSARHFGSYFLSTQCLLFSEQESTLKSFLHAFPPAQPPA